MFNIKVRLDKKSFQEKPNKEEVKGISIRLGNSLAEDIEWAKFCNLVGESGCSFSPADFYGSRKNENFKSQQIFGLDFDGGVSFEDIETRSIKLKIPIALAYETFSSKNCNKFRVVFVCNTEIYDVTLRDKVTAKLIELFPESDKTCSDAARLYFGGKKVIKMTEIFPFNGQILNTFKVKDILPNEETCDGEFEDYNTTNDAHILIPPKLHSAVQKTAYNAGEELANFIIDMANVANVGTDKDLKFVAKVVLKIFKEDFSEGFKSCLLKFVKEDGDVFNVY